MENKPKIVGDNSNHVIFYGWRRDITKDRIGHVVIKTHIEGTYGIGNYASFWPDIDEDTLTSEGIQKKLRTGAPPYHPKTLDEDIRNEEGHHPDVVIHLYSLDVKKINKLYEEFRDGKQCNWSILGSSFIKDSNTHNCSSLVAVLLNAGGISNLVETYNFNVAEGTGRADIATTNLAFVATMGTAATVAKINADMDIKKIAVTAKVALTATAITGLVSSAITPNDVIALVEKARAAELEQYEIENDENISESSRAHTKFCNII